MGLIDDIILIVVGVVLWAFSGAVGSAITGAPGTTVALVLRILGILLVVIGVILLIVDLLGLGFCSGHGCGM
jgi:hypothetical protein